MSATGSVLRGATLRTVLVAVLLGALATVLLLVAVATHVSLRNQLDAQLDAELDRAVARSGGPGPGDEGDPLDVLQAPGAGEFQLAAVVRDGEAVRGAWIDDAGDMRELGDADLALITEALAPTGTEGSRGVDVELSIGTYRVALASSDQVPSGEEPLVTGISTDAADGTIARLDLTLLLVSLVALLATGLAGSVIVRRTLHPLEEVAGVATRVADLPLGSGTVTVPDRVDDQIFRSGNEVGEVGRALNGLLGAVEGALDSRQKSEERMRRFIADASHELRTPLTAIRGYTELLRLTETLSADGAESLHRVEAQSARMTSLVEDLLLLARLDDGAPREHVRVDLGELLLEAQVDARVAAPGHRWELDLPDQPVEVQGDPRQLTQVLVNLLSNAHKHTPRGSRISTSLAARGVEAVLVVADDGPGIPDFVQGEVFDRFTRADHSRSGGEATTGLGLPIVQGILEGHGGRIDLESEPGRTAFTARLPLAG